MSPSRRRRRASPEWEGRAIITAATLPGRGLYVRHLGHPEGVDGVHRPTVPLPGAVHRNPAHFEPRWLAEHVSGVDVVHVHGVPARLTPDEVVRAVSVVRAAGRPLVVTLYHTSDPSGTDESGFAAQLDELVPRADAVLTLTPRAAAEIRHRWEVDALVVPHPHAVDFVRMRRARPEQRRGGFVIGVHLGSLRMPGDPVEVIGAVATAAGAVPGARLQVHVHDHLLDPGASRYTPATVHAIERIVTEAGGTVRTHRPMTDAQLWDHLFSLDVSVVPPLFGSHSIWPEACFDLGTNVVLPRDSHAGEQRSGLCYAVDGHGVPDPGSLADALVAARARGEWRADPTERWKERVRIAETLRGLYERLLAHRITPGR